MLELSYTLRQLRQGCTTPDAWVWQGWVASVPHALVSHFSTMYGTWRLARSLSLDVWKTIKVIGGHRREKPGSHSWSQPRENFYKCYRDFVSKLLECLDLELNFKMYYIHQLNKRVNKWQILSSKTGVGNPSMQVLRVYMINVKLCNRLQEHPAIRMDGE